MKNFELKKILQENKIKINDKQLQQLLTFQRFVIESNKKFNLTSIVDENEFNIKHFLDSLILVNFFEGFKQNQKIIDVGSGGGFPGIPLAILFPKANFVLVDATTKKTFFLNETIQLLDLKNVQIINGRAELLDELFFEFDYAISRGFAPLAINLEILAPFLKPKGQIILYKTPKETNNISFEKISSKLKKINLVYKNQKLFLLENKFERNFIFFQSIASKKNIKQREYKEIKKNPLF